MVLQEIGHLRIYVRLMEHWDPFAGAVLRVQHEDVLEDLNGQCTELPGLSGPTFDRPVSIFTKQKRQFALPVPRQVRQPIPKRASIYGPLYPFAAAQKMRWEAKLLEPQQ